MKIKGLLLALVSLSIAYAESAAATAAACFNSRLFDQGVVLEYRYRTKDRISGEKIISNSTQTVIGREMYRGKNAVLMTTESTVSQDGVKTSIQSDTYFSVQRAKKRYRTFGVIATTFLEGVDQGTAEVVFTPAELLRYDLAPGQRHTQKFEAETTTTALGESFSSAIVQRITRLYVGRQRIKVPLGQRDTCKFRVVTRAMQFGVTTKSISIEWFDVKTGLLLKERNNDTITVLLKLLIDGVKA